MMMRCSKEEHDQLFPKVRYKYLPFDNDKWREQASTVPNAILMIHEEIAQWRWEENEPETNQQLEGLPTSIETLQVGLGGTLLVWDEYPERTQSAIDGLQKIIDGAGCLHGIPHDDQGSSKPTYRYDRKTGGWKRTK